MVLNIIKSFDILFYLSLYGIMLSLHLGLFILFDLINLSSDKIGYSTTVILIYFYVLQSINYCFIKLFASSFSALIMIKLNTPNLFYFK